MLWSKSARLKRGILEMKEKSHKSSAADVMPAYSNPDDPRNSAEYWTGKICIEAGCMQPAGTAWSPHWCLEHNAERMKRINDKLEQIISDLEA